MLLLLVVKLCYSLIPITKLMLIRFCSQDVHILFMTYTHDNILAASHGIRYTAHPLWKGMKEEAKVALPQPPNMSKDGDTLLYGTLQKHNW